MRDTEIENYVAASIRNQLKNQYCEDDIQDCISFVWLKTHTWVNSGIHTETPISTFVKSRLIDWIRAYKRAARIETSDIDSLTDDKQPSLGFGEDDILDDITAREAAVEAIRPFFMRDLDQISSRYADGIAAALALRKGVSRKKLKDSGLDLTYLTALAAQVKNA